MIKLLHDIHRLAVIPALIVIATLAAGARQSYRYGVAEGLSNGSVTSITSDPYGHIWIATNEGLNKFDGKRFTRFTRDNSGLTANELNCVVADPVSPYILWIATQRDGICRINTLTGNIDTRGQSRLLSTDITDIVPSRDGHGLWFVQYHYGVQYYNPATDEVRTYNHMTIEGLPRQCWTMTEGPEGKLYIGHVNGGLSVVDTLSHTFTNYRHDVESPGLPGDDIYTLAQDNAGYIWLGTDRGAALFNPDTRRFVPFVHDHSDSSSIGPGRVKDIAVMSDGEIWFATTQGGISILPAKSYAYTDITAARFSSIRSIAPDTRTESASCIYEDSFGNIWTGKTYNGFDVINRLQPCVEPIRYNTPGPNSNIDSRPVWSCTTDIDGNLWFGGDSHIARCGDNSVTATILPLPSSCSRTRVTALLADDSRRLWIGTDDHGAMIYNIITGRFTSLRDTPKDIRSFHPGPDGSMLVATTRGIYRVDNGAVSPMDSLNKTLNDPVVQDIVVDGKGRIWVATFGKGLYVFDSDYRRLAWHQTKDGFPSNAVSHLFIDSSHRMWAATRAGLILFRDIDHFDRYINVTDSVGINTGHTKSINEAGDHFIMVGTTRGILRVNPDDLKASFFTGGNNQPINSFVDRATTRDTDGTLYFASTNGVFRVNTDLIKSLNKANQQARIMSINIDGAPELNPAGDSRKISLEHDHNSFHISFNIPDHSMREYMEYAFMLRGVDANWVYADDDNLATYRNLQPGQYDFLLKQRVKGSEWEDAVNMLSVSILPPLWLTWWAKTLYILLALTLIFTVAHYYRRRVNLRQRLKAQIKSNREREKLNEERLRFYTNITHELRTPLTLIMGPIEDMAGDPSLPDRYQAKLRVIHESSTRLLQLINGILEFRKTETQNRHLVVCHGNPGNLVREMALRYKELNRNPKVTVSLDIDDSLPEIYYDREILMIVVNNLLSNAMKYTPSGRIDVTCKPVTDGNTRYVQVSVADTGYGIAPEAVPHIFERYYQAGGKHQAEGSGIGLALVKSLVDLHGGSITVDSVRGKGSTFTLRLPVDETYPDAEHADTDSLPDTHAAVTGEQHDPQPDPGRNTILVVEDNDDIRDYIAQILADRFTVITARNGYEGLQKVNEQMPTMVVSDIMMPELDGIEMCRAIKENMLTSHIPVILLTARDTLSDKQQGYESGADSYLTKPFTANLLTSRIDNLLKQRIDLANRLLATPPIIFWPTRERTRLPSPHPPRRPTRAPTWDASTASSSTRSTASSTTISPARISA